MAKRRVYVVDDEEPIRRAAQLMLRVQGYQAGVFESGRSLIDKLEILEPGCILLDVRMPHVDGLQVQRELRQRGAPHTVVMMTGHGDVAVAVAALENGAAAFLEKPFPKAVLVRALEQAFLRLEDPAGFEEKRRAARALVEGLNDQDQQILIGLAKGRSHEAIAAASDRSTAEVELRRAAIFALLGVETLTEALTTAHFSGLLRSS